MSRVPPDIPAPDEIASHGGRRVATDRLPPTALPQSREQREPIPDPLLPAHATG